MVSPLWKASSEGNVSNLVEFLKEATPVDIEVKDHTGVTPLIEAVKNAHTEAVRILLDRGADPTNASSQGLPESYTSDPVILGLLSAAKGKMRQPSAMQPDGSYLQEQPADINHVDPATTGFYPPPPGAYYYPPMPVPPPMMPDGSVPYYVPPPPMPTDQNPSGLGNLPPPEVARMIPCRYFPACRYGTACMFAHPQGPYAQQPLSPPSPYPPTSYDSINPSPYQPPTYYPVPPTNYAAPPNGAPVGPISPPPSLVHTSSGSEIMSPIQSPFTPPHGQPPVPYGLVTPVSPNTYGHPAPIPIPVSVPPLPSLQTSTTTTHSPQPGLYTPISPGAQGGAPYTMPPHYAPQKLPLNGDPADLVSPKSAGHDAYATGPVNRDMTHHRRGSARRPSFGGRGGKPPCLFFPSGRCRNGDDCRFPHVLPDGPGSQSHFSARGGHRPRPPYHANGVATLEDKFAAMTTQDDKLVANNRNGTDASTDSSRSHSTDPSQKGRPPLKAHVNGFRQDRRPGPVKPQRVPSADEFPVLCGSVPLSRASSNGTTTPGYPGPTAAQVLQAPPPRRDVYIRESSPDQSVSAPAPKEVIGSVPEPINKLPLSFAAAATAAPEAAKEVSVSA